MTQIDGVLSDDIVAALGASNHSPVGSSMFKTFAPYIGHSVEIVGEDHLDDLVDMRSLCDVASRYLNWLVGNKEFKDAFGDEQEMLLMKMYCENRAESLTNMAEDREAILKQLNMTEAMLIQRDFFGLNETAREMYRNGELTFAKLLVTSPEVFMPLI